jgi:hypothetical protein
LTVWSTFVLGVLSWAPPAAAQQDGEDTAVEVLGAVISHRLLTQDDATRFNGCILFGFLGGLDTLIERLGPLSDRAFDRVTDPCGGPETEGSRAELYFMRLGESLSQVVLQVVAPGGSHFEDYTLRPPPVVIDGMAGWVVDEVRRY